MQRTTIFLDETLKREIQALARRQSRPAAAIVREAIVRHLEAEGRKGRPTPSFVGIGASGRSDTAERHEELLFRGLEAHPPASRPRKGPRQRRR